jgi:hypothetical protein
MDSLPGYPQVRHLPLRLNIPQKNMVGQIFRSGMLIYTDCLMLPEQLVAVSPGRARVAAALPGKFGCTETRLRPGDMPIATCGIPKPA